MDHTFINHIPNLNLDIVICHWENENGCVNGNLCNSMGCGLFVCFHSDDRSVKIYALVTYAKGLFYLYLLLLESRYALGQSEKVVHKVEKCSHWYTLLYWTPFRSFSLISMSILAMARFFISSSLSFESSLPMTLSARVLDWKEKSGLFVQWKRTLYVQDRLQFIE